VSLLFLLVPSAGAMGAALALLVSYAAFTAGVFIVARRRLGEAMPVDGLAPAGLALAVGGAVLLLGQSYLGRPTAGFAGAAIALGSYCFTRPALLREVLRRDWLLK